jgi:hypothetical protein
MRLDAVAASQSDIFNSLDLKRHERNETFSLAAAAAAAAS